MPAWWIQAVESLPSVTAGKGGIQHVMLSPHFHPQNHGRVGPKLGHADWSRSERLQVEESVNGPIRPHPADDDFAGPLWVRGVDECEEGVHIGESIGPPLLRAGRPLRDTG